jgi:hypothetical protein
MKGDQLKPGEVKLGNDPDHQPTDKEKDPDGKGLIDDAIVEG